MAHELLSSSSPVKSLHKSLGLQHLHLRREGEGGGCRALWRRERGAECLSLLMLLIFWVSRRPKGDRERERERERERGEREREFVRNGIP
jgi:hypothetical protein